jgi:hypothetical protein
MDAGGRDFIQFLPQLLRAQTGIDQCTEDHIPTGSGKTVKISDAHAQLLRTSNVSTIIQKKGHKINRNNELAHPQFFPCPQPG